MKWIKTFESVSSQKYLEQLTIDILKLMAKKTMDIIKKNNLQYIRLIPIVHLPNLDISKYNEDDKKFITETAITIYPVKKLKGSVKGSNANGSYDITTRSIYLNVNESLIEDINDALNNPKQYGEHIITLDESDLYFKFWYAFNSTLLHELQHAWDDWNSKGKFLNTKRWYEYDNNIVKYQDVDDFDIRYKLHTNYLKLNHEVNARFSQAMQQTSFWSVEPKPPYNQFKKSFDVVKKEFIVNFEGWKVMTPNIQKRLLQRLYNFWVSDYKKRDTVELNDD
jgi:hypothetical protein